MCNRIFMNKSLLITTLVGITIFSWHTSKSQSTCAQTLRTARSTYDQGRLHELPALLEGCLRNGFTKQEKVEAYKLLTLTYIYLEEPGQADATMLKLLHTDPYFELNETADPAEFIALYRTFRTWPIYRMGAKVGVNATMPSIVSYVDALEGVTARYKPAINFQAGVVFELPLSDKLTLNPELYFQLRSFHYDSTVGLDTTLVNTSEGTESQSWLSLPISLQYAPSNKSRLNPYVSVGVSVDYLLNASLTMNRIRINANSTQERTFGVKEDRSNINLSAIASAGIKAKLGGGYVVSELRFIYGIKKINDKTAAFSIDDYLLFDNGYADNIMKLNSIAVTAGYVYNVFNPKKLKNRR